MVMLCRPFITSKCIVNSVRVGLNPLCESIAFIENTAELLPCKLPYQHDVCLWFRSLTVHSSRMEGPRFHNLVTSSFYFTVIRFIFSDYEHWFEAVRSCEVLAYLCSVIAIIFLCLYICRNNNRPSLTRVKVSIILSVTSCKIQSSIPNL